MRELEVKQRTVCTDFGSEYDASRTQSLPKTKKPINPSILAHPIILPSR